jgi:hypothetical protein
MLVESRRSRRDQGRVCEPLELDQLIYHANRKQRVDTLTRDDLTRERVSEERRKRERTRDQSAQFVPPKHSAVLPVHCLRCFKTSHAVSSSQEHYLRSALWQRTVTRIAIEKVSLLEFFLPQLDFCTPSSHVAGCTQSVKYLKIGRGRE